MESFVFTTLFAAISSYFFCLFFAKYFRTAGIVGEDVHKRGKVVLPTSGGVPVFFAFFFSTMLYSFYLSYILQTDLHLLEICASVLSIAVVTLVGFVDDVNVKEGLRKGLEQWQKPLLTLPAAIPLMALKLGTPVVTLPIVGRINVGIAYPLLLVPLGVVGASNMVNLLGGLNGLEAGLGIIYLTSLSLFAYFHVSSIAAKVVGFAALGSVIGFFILNRYPARFLPGDSLTYFLGAVIANMAITGNMEKAALIASAPFIIEFLLKARGRFRIPTVGYVRGGKIYRRCRGIYSIPHLWMNGKYTEKEIVLRVWMVELIFALLVWLV